MTKDANKTKKIPLNIIGIPLNFTELSEKNFSTAVPQQALLALVDANIIYTSRRIYKSIHKFTIFNGIKFQIYEKPLVAKLKQKLTSNQTKKLVILATGDPNFYGIASTIYKFDPKIISKYKITVYSSISSIQMALSRLLWGLAETQIVSLHGRPIRSLLTKLNHDKKIIIIPNDNNTLNEVVIILKKFAKPSTYIHVLENLSLKNEKIFSIKLANYKSRKINGLYLIGINFKAKDPQIFPGLSDNSFLHDGQITKQEMRSLILNRLLKFSSGCLWDIGSGSGSISVEWLQYPNNSSILFERDKARINNITKNLEYFGLSNYDIINKNIKGNISEFDTLTQPKAIFIGGGLSKNLLKLSKHQIILNGGIIVVCFVTLLAQSMVLNDYLFEDKDKSGKLKKEIISVNIEKAVNIKKTTSSLLSWLQPKHNIGLYILSKDS